MSPEQSQHIKIAKKVRKKIKVKLCPKRLVPSNAGKLSSGQTTGDLSSSAHFHEKWKLKKRQQEQTQIRNCII
jgi:intein-encoded DNA endonuclease-like protein